MQALYHNVFLAYDGLEMRHVTLKVVEGLQLRENGLGHDRGQLVCYFIFSGSMIVVDDYIRCGLARRILKSGS